MTMRAAILQTLTVPLYVDTLQIPDLEVGQVLVEVHASGICGAQLGEISGAKGEDKYLPHLMGHEGGGIVRRIGPGVTHVKEGDHVVMHWRKGVGIESRPPVYRRQEDGSLVGAGWVTTFNDHAVVSENRLTPIDKDIPFDIAALMGCAVTTGLGLVNNEAKLKIGQSIAVAGCGGVGMNVIQGAVMVGANLIVGIDIHQHKLERILATGASVAINTSIFGGRIYSISQEIRKWISSGVDVFVDCTGNMKMIEEGLKTLAPGGKLILVGQPSWCNTLTIEGFRNHFYDGKIIMDSQGGLTNPTVDIPRYLNLYRIGKLKLDGLITHRFPLEQVNEALTTVRSGAAGRCILEMK